jgi:hypothetical protein
LCRDSTPRRSSGYTPNASLFCTRLDCLQQPLQWPLKNLLPGRRNSLHFFLKLCGRLNLAGNIRFPGNPAVTTPRIRPKYHIGPIVAGTVVQHDSKQFVVFSGKPLLFNNEKLQDWITMGAQNLNLVLIDSADLHKSPLGFLAVLTSKNGTEIRRKYQYLRADFRK